MNSTPQKLVTWDSFYELVEAWESVRAGYNKDIDEHGFGVEIPGTRRAAIGDAYQRRTYQLMEQADYLAKLPKPANIRHRIIWRACRTHSLAALARLVGGTW